MQWQVAWPGLWRCAGSPFGEGERREARGGPRREKVGFLSSLNCALVAGIDRDPRSYSPGQGSVGLAGSCVELPIRGG